MAFGDKRVIVDIQEIKDGEILYTDKDGTKTTYYPNHSICLELETLEVLTLLGEPKNGAEPPVLTRVRGVAVLEDRSISVVGDPRSMVRKLSISFEAGDWKPKPVEPKEGEFLVLRSVLGGAMLGFNRADWEIGSDDEWWISCYLSTTFIDALIADVRGGQLDGVKVSLSLRGLYTSTHTLIPASERGDLFIRPNRRDNSLAIPDSAQGHVVAMQFTSSPRDLRKSEPIEPIESVEEGASPAPIPDPVAVAIAALSARVDQMRSTLKWIGGFIVVALLFVAGR